MHQVPAGDEQSIVNPLDLGDDVAKVGPQIARLGPDGSPICTMKATPTRVNYNRETGFLIKNIS
jgi:hypothetical protein